MTIKPVFEIEGREGVWKAVERGLGISVVADFVRAASELAGARDQRSYDQDKVSIAHHAERGHSPIIKAFLETVSRMKDSAAKHS